MTDPNFVPPPGERPFSPPPGAGSYDRDPETGKLTLVEAATRDHPDGNRARNADGTPVDTALPVPTIVTPPAVAPAVAPRVPPAAPAVVSPVPPAATATPPAETPGAGEAQ